jgi:hypothetical protein
MKKWLAGIALIGWFVLYAPTVSACTCIVPDVKDALKQADAVFVGRVKEIIEPKTAPTALAGERKFFTIMFEVEQSWKGATFAKEFAVLSAHGADECFAFPKVKKGERYLVYADPLFQDGVRQTGWSVITNCGRTVLSTNAAADIRTLNSLTSPIRLTPVRLR